MKEWWDARLRGGHAGGGHIIIVLNECVAQTGESQVIKERNTASECGGRVDPLGFDVVCRV